MTTAGGVWYRDHHKLDLSRLFAPWDANGNPNGGRVLDGNGDWIDSNGYITGAGNRLLSNGVYNFTFDKSGHMLTQVPLDQSVTGGFAERDFSWDNRGRMIDVSDKDSSGRVTQDVALSYDMFGRLIGRTLTLKTYSGSYTMPSTTTITTGRFVYDGKNMVLAFNGTGALTDRYLWGPAVDQILADEHFNPTSAGQMPTHALATDWAVTDNEGTVRDLMWYYSVQSHLVYNAFGQITTDIGWLSIPFLHNGTYYDPATGLELHGLRWYNPVVKRWLSEDPIHDGTNPYEYCRNSPTNGTDSSGLCGPIKFGGKVGRPPGHGAWDQLMRGLYTGDMSAPDNVYRAGTEGGGQSYIQGAGYAHRGLNGVGATGLLTGPLAGFGTISSYALQWIEGRELHNQIMRGRIGQENGMRAARIVPISAKGQPAQVPIGDLRPLQDAAHRAPRPGMQCLSDDELLNAARNPANGDGIVINTNTGMLSDGNGRVIELQNRMMDPNSSISPDMGVPVEYYTPDNSMFWDLP